MDQESKKQEMMEREVREAILAGESALSSLKAAKEQLKSARNWGMFDLFGGGLLADFFKHSKMNEAASMLEEAKRELLVFQRELKDVQVPMDFRMEIGGFLSFADFFFDGLVVDYLVQSKIAEAREQVEDAIIRVERILYDLRKL